MSSDEMETAITVGGGGKRGVFDHVRRQGRGASSSTTAGLMLLISSAPPFIKKKISKIQACICFENSNSQRLTRTLKRQAKLLDSTLARPAQ